MLQTWTTFAIEWLPVAAIAVLVSVFSWRRLWRDLPFFFLYLVSVLLVGIVRYLSFHFGAWHYFYVYWISDMAASLVAFFPMYEVFLRRMFAKFYKVRFYQGIFPLAGVIILILTVFTAVQAHDKKAAFQMAARGFDFMRTAVLIFFIGLMVFMGRAWTRYDLGITLGFAIQASVALANAAVKVRTHYRPTPLDTAEIVAYNISCVIWLVAFSRPEKAASHIGPGHLDHGTLQEVRTWESMLKSWLVPGRNKR